MGDQTVTLEDILHNRTTGELSRGAFSRFLAKNLAENLLEFWVMVQDFHNLYEPENELSTYSIFKLDRPAANLLESKQEQKLAQQKTIVASYIASDSPLEINISDSIRNNILQRLEEGEKTNSPPDQLFNEAQQEVAELMLTNYFSKFTAYASHKISSKKSIRLVDILHSKTSGPLSRDAFSKYLAEQGCEKWLQIWVNIQKYYDTYEAWNPRSTVSINKGEVKKDKKKEKEMEKDKHNMALEIIKKYEVDEDFNQLLQEASLKTNSSSTPEKLFDETQIEVEKYLENDHFLAFLEYKRQTYVNRRSLKPPTSFKARPPPPRKKVPKVEKEKESQENALEV